VALIGGGRGNGDIAVQGLSFPDGFPGPVPRVQVVDRVPRGREIHGDHAELQRPAALEQEDLGAGVQAEEPPRPLGGIGQQELDFRGAVTDLHHAHSGAPEIE
jgi:hypothetical protein